MARTRFARMLSDRRKQLRLSIPQAAKVLRMRESVLEAFEEGDFARLPALGYAQGMISSYARYLGLDSRQVAELYEREHAEYVSGVTGREPSALARLEDEPFIDGPASAASDSRSNFPASSARSSSAHSLALPSSGTYRSYSVYGAPAGAAAGREAYASGSNGRGERRYTTRVPYAGDDRTRRQQDARARRARGQDGYQRPDERSGATARYGVRSDYDQARTGARTSGRAVQQRSQRGYGSARSDEITMRRVGSGQYRDDMRFDGAARPYRPSSTRAGREASHGMVAPERPNVRRRKAPQGRDPRARRPQQASGGVLAGILSDQRRMVLVIGLALAVALVLILTFSIRSCAAGSSDGRQVPVVTVTTTDAASTTSATTTSAAEQQALSEAAAKKAASDAAAQSQETKVTVTVADGSTTWVDIVSDGKQQVAETVTGAWSQEYTVTKSLTIQVGDSSAVTVEKNGERVQLTKTSGTLASATITGTDPTASSTSATTAATTAASSGSASARN